MMHDDDYDNQHNEDFSGSNKRKRSESPSASNEEKRRKLEPSKVLFLRQLPTNVTEHDILSVIPEDEYGRPNVVILRNQHSAFIGFDSIDMAKKFLDNLTDGEIYIKDRSAKVTWSERQELERKQQDDNEQPCRVLHCTVVGARLPLYVNNVDKFFGDYGVEKVTCFTSKNGVQQALIQFKSVDDAATAKAAVEGQEMFNNCRIQLNYSKIDDLTVKYNNDRSRDYSRSDLPTGPTQNQRGGYGQQGGYDQRGGYPQQAPGGYDQLYGGYTGYDQTYPTEYDAYGGGYGGYPQQPQPAYGAPPQQYGGYGAQHDNRGFMQQGGMGGRVLLVNNLSPKTTCDELFILFGVWGDVDAVKILDKKPDTAFVEFTTPQGAETALQNTKGQELPLHGQMLVVQRSKHHFIKPPRFNEGDSSQTFKSYKNHAHHRYGKSKRGIKAYKNIAPPSTTLHFANLHGDVTEEELKAYVDPYGTVKSIHLFGKKECTTKDGEPTTKQMAIVEFGSLSGAVRVLVNRHVGDELKGFKPRISFSRKSNQQRNTMME